MSNKSVTLSKHQQAIHAWFAKDDSYPYDAPVDVEGNLIVSAYAGTGKTFTILGGVNKAPEQKILLAAFNKRIADEMKFKLTNPRAQVQTLHSVGFACLRKFRENIRLEDRDNAGQRAEALARACCGVNAPDQIVRLVSKLHTKGREIVPHARKYDDLIDIAVNFECEPDEYWQDSDYDTNYVVQKALLAMEAAAQLESGQEIDFADMIFLPVRNHWMTKMYDLGVVDEAQDMTVAQLELFTGVVRGRKAVVGDRHQAIYAWRGADSDSLDRLKQELCACELRLPVTYRCGRVIVEKNQMFVPDYEAGPDNPEGEILELPLEKLIETAAHGDFILSRLNAPLVPIAMSLLKQGKRARIAGRDIGAGLKTLIRKLAKGRAANSIPEFLDRIAVWEEKESTRLRAMKKEARIEVIRDQASMLREMADGANSVNEIASRIDALFTDDGLGQMGVITCSSVHRAKGLEANRVFVLTNTLRGYNQEELNIQYVAFTRAKETLVLVNGEVR